MWAPQHDVQRRSPVWNQLQMQYMDTDGSAEYAFIARVCAESGYSLEELAQILRGLIVDQRQRRASAAD